jgi:ABC-type multidrug transport system ATPase subunit
MNEPILRALIQLFALISDIGNINEISTREKDVVRSFLARHLNSELVDRYMKIFDEYLDLYYNQEAIRESAGDRDISSQKAIRIKRICERINKELRQKQKIYVIIQLIDFISYGKEITDNELDFLMTLALALNIPENEYRNIKSFIIDPVSKVHEKEKLLLINNSQSCKYRKIKHIYNSNFSGELMFLNITSTKTFILRYNGDRNLYLNGQHIFPRQTYLFDNGSTIKGQGLNTVYYSEVFGYFNEAKPEAKISLSAKDLVFRFADSENGIQNFNFHEESGQLVGILGVSGTGKSTLLNLLNGNLKPQSGDIFVNGYNLNNVKERNKIKGIIGFVPQDDLLIEELTVYQNIYYSARLCLSNFPPKKISKIVNKIMGDLDLSEIKNLKVGSPLDKVISGGQRKRINIALELVREPHILFVDEPTSGLSSVDSEVVINLLKEQTYKGKLVIVNIHQPCSDLYKLFDKIIILDKGGYQIYYGNPNAAVVYFKTLSKHADAEEDQCTKCGNINTEQVLQIVEAKIVNEHGKLTQTRKVTPQEWADLFRQNFNNPTKNSPVPKEKLPDNFYSIPGLFKQMRIFFIRDLLSKLANKQYILISLLGAPLLALVLGYFTRYIKGNSYQFSENENLPAYLFMCVITSLFLGLIISSEEILKDRKILKRESFLNLSWFSYINSKSILMFLISAIQTISFILVGNFILGIKGMTLSYWLVLFATSCCANMLGLNISSAFNSVITIYILIPFILIPQLLFSGVLVKFDKLHRNSHSSLEYVPVIGELMPARWSFEALAVEQFKNNKFERNFFDNDLKASQNTWYADYLIYELKKDLKNLEEAETDSIVLENNLKKLNFYIEHLSGLAGFAVPFDIKPALNKEKLDTAIVKRTLAYLDLLAKQFQGFRKKATVLKDFISDSIVRYIGNEEFQNLRANYYNKRLADIVLNNEVPEKSIQTPDRIVQKYEPIFMKPVSQNGRAQFYAPYKIFGNREIDTYWFNILVIGAVTIILYVILYYNLLRKLVSFFENLRVQRSDDIIISY